LPAPKHTLVRSKLLVPSPAGLLHRPRVCQAIEQGLSCRLTLVYAPAGYGKTSAMVDFARHSPTPVCWYTADERDRDMVVFTEYLVAAIRERFPDFGKRTQAALASLSSDIFYEPTGIVGTLVNEMIDVDDPLVVMVDNYDALEGALGIRTFVHRLIEVLPFNCHLMLVSRVLPEVPVTHLVAKRQLVGLAAQDLCFTPQEIQELLESSHVEISESEAHTIATKSEGWITGVLLLTDLLREGARATLLDTGRATTETYAYLAREVLNRQPPDIQHFLHTSVVLREMSSRLCHQILHVQEPRSLLTELERRNLFVTRFGRGGAATYRYHNLFRDFLHEQLRRRDPDHFARLHLRAAEHFEKDNDVEEAVYHYLTAEAYPEATKLMERVALEWFTRGRVETISHWAEELPEDMSVQAPWLSLYHSKALTDRLDYEHARQALAHAEAGFAARGETTRLAEVHNQRALLGLFEGRYEDVITEAQAAMDMLHPEDITGRAHAQRLIGRALVGLGRFAEGIGKLQGALALYRQVESTYNVVNLLQDLTLAFTAQGSYDDAATCLNEALAIGRRLGAPTLLAGVLNNLGCLHHYRGEYQKALVLYEEGLAAARRGGDRRFQAYISVGMADVYRDVGAYDRAEPMYRTGWQIAQENQPSLAVYVLTARADMVRWQGDHERAHTLIEHARQLAEEKGLEFETQGLLPVAEGITLAQSGEVEKGLHLLTQGTGFLEQRRAKRELARGRFLLAEAHLLAGNQSQAVVELRRALDLAEEIGTLQFAVAEGQRAEDLLSLGVAEGIASTSEVAERVLKLRAFRKEILQGGLSEEEETDHLEIYALGEGRVVCDGHPVASSEWQAAMAKELFFYILLHGPVERDAIGVVFWPELPLKKMRNSFHTTIHRIRRAVGADVIVLEGGRYCLGDVDYWFDIEEFESLVERAQLLPSNDWQTEDLWQRAVALYQGDFLPEVERVWCVPKRESLREMYIKALIGIGRCYEVRREFEQAITWYRRALEAEELREDVHRRIMECYNKAGRRAEALAQYYACRRVLKKELGLEPSAETQRLYEQIAGKSPD